MKFRLHLCAAHSSIDIKYFHLWYTKSTCSFFDSLLCFRLWLMKIMRDITYMQCVFGAATTSLVYHALLLSANINITPCLPVALPFCVFLCVCVCTCVRVSYDKCALYQGVCVCVCVVVGVCGVWDGVVFLAKSSFLACSKYFCVYGCIFV